MCASSDGGVADRNVTLASRMARILVLGSQLAVPRNPPSTGNRELGTENWSLLVQRINREAAQQLGVKIGGLLGHDFSSQRDFAHLIEAGRIHQERHLHLST